MTKAVLLKTCAETFKRFRRWLWKEYCSVRFALFASASFVALMAEWELTAIATAAVAAFWMIKDYGPRVAEQIIVLMFLLAVLLTVGFAAKEAYAAAAATAVMAFGLCLIGDVFDQLERAANSAQPDEDSRHTEE